jgi:hypothetical protein
MNEAFMLFKSDGTPIEKWQDWARPKREYQWVSGRSAMELGKVWFRHGNLSMPREMSNLFQNEKRLNGLELSEGKPEHVTKLPEGTESRGRNHDLWLIGNTINDKVTICIEAKADEPFGDNTVAAHGVKAVKDNKSSRVPERIRKLLALVPGDPDKWQGIRYQLLTALTGTAIQAKIDKSDFAVFVVHEFRTWKTSPENHDRNALDFETFLNTIGIEWTNKNPEILYGPVKVDGIDCYVGKITTEITKYNEIQRIIEEYDNDSEFLVQDVFTDGGIDPLFPRLDRAALNQAEDGDATVSRYAIWSNTVRDNIRQGVEEMEIGNINEAKRLLKRSANSLSAFSEIQALFDTMF